MEPEKESPFLSGFEQYKILRPSAAYRQACSSYPYRISELVFGSLLASYILGFVSVGISELNTVTSDPWKILFNAIVYLTICCSFSFLTAVLYSVYHNSILTMPNVPISDLTTDFMIAISQALLFGVSIIWPSVFLICLGASLLLVLRRQKAKFEALALFFYKQLKVEIETTPAPENSARDNPNPVQAKKIHGLFEKKLSEEKLLDGWGPVRNPQYGYALTLISLGILVVWGYWYQPLPFLNGKIPWPKFLTGVEYEAVRGMIYLIVGYFFIHQTKRILKEKSKAMDDLGQNIIQKMDEPATRLAKAIKETPEKNS